MAEKKPLRDPNQPTPKDGPKKAPFGVRVLKFLFFVVFLLVLATMITYSLKIQTWPWAWTNEQWKGYFTFSQEKAEQAKDEVASYDWGNLKTKITGKTQELWNDAPEVKKRIQDKLSGKPTTPQPGQPAPPAKPGDATQRAANVQSPTAVTPERQLALTAMRDAITHYRKSPDDPGELALAKKGFEEASAHFEKALKETNDDQAKSEIQQELTDCNRYLEDCRAREKP